MAIAMLMDWPEVTPELYEQVRKEVNWEGNRPEGAKFHVAWMGEDGFHVLDLWESEAACQQFMEKRLASGIANTGIEGQPKVRFGKTLSVFAPDPSH